jgi:hypothetical protein
MIVRGGGNLLDENNVESVREGLREVFATTFHGKWERDCTEGLRPFNTTQRLMNRKIGSAILVTKVDHIPIHSPTNLQYTFNIVKLFMSFFR